MSSVSESQQAKVSLFSNRRCPLCKTTNVPRTSRYLEKPFICDYLKCNMAFKAHGHLKDHKKRHFNIR